MLSDIPNSVRVAGRDSSRAPDLINSHNTRKMPIAYCRQVRRIINIAHLPTGVALFLAAQRWTM